MVRGGMRALVALLVAASLWPSAAAAGPTVPIDVRVQSSAPWHGILTLTDAAGRAVVTDEHDYQAGEDVHQIEAPAERYQAELREQAVAAGPYVMASGTLDLAGCLGRGQVTYTFFHASDGGAVLYGTDEAGYGCLGPTAASAALLAEARRAPGAGGDPIRVPAPALGDRGRVRIVPRAGDVDHAPNATFAWAAATFPDAWARPASGAELRATLDDAGACGAETAGASSSASAEAIPRVVRYAGGAAVAESEATCSAHALSSEGDAGGASLTQAMRYRDLDGFSCLFRNGAQGRAIRPGDAVAGACPAWGEGWRAGGRATRGNLSAIPLYRVAGDATRGEAAVLWLGEGVAYPLFAERWTWRPDAPARHEAYRLDALVPGPGALPEGSAPAPPAPPAGALDPLDGPAAGDVLSFSLADASRAARADPTLRDLQALLARADAALAGAELTTSRDATTGAQRPAWRLIYDAPDAAPVAVSCARVASPLVRCQPAPRDAGPFDALGWPPSLGRAQLPTRAAGFSDALARWRALDPRAGAPTHALYRAWDDGILLVGDDADALVPGGQAPASSGSAVALRLADGATTTHLATARTVTPLAAIPAGVLARGGSAPSAGLSIPAALQGVSPVAVGAGALALVTLAALLALYARLRGGAVLASDARLRILARVAADPGIHAAPLLAELGRGNGRGEHHLAVLVREGHLACVATPGFRRYFVAGSMDARAMRRVAFLRDGPCARLYEEARARPDITLSEAARGAGLSLPYASRTAKRLAQAGLLERRREGGAVRLRATEE